MAELQNKTSHQNIKLRSQHIFGRHSGNSNTVLENLEASRLHASIHWNGSYWLIQDTSSNGTYVNRQAINNGIKTRLRIDDIIQFGHLDSDQWILKSDSAPKSLLISIENHNKYIELEGIVVLPNAKNPSITFYQTADGQWVYEDKSGVKTLKPGVKISLNNNHWYFVSAENIDDTKKAHTEANHTIENTKIIFNVSKNEEHVTCSISQNNTFIDLGERIHHYLVMFLAKIRLIDVNNGISMIDQGWIDKDLLSKQIGLEENHINILIFRFRKQLFEKTPPSINLLQLIERRRGCVRFALNHIEINGGNKY